MMDNKLFNKIQHAFTFLNNHYGRTHRDNIHFEMENYNGYFIERFNARGDVLNVIRQLKDLDFEAIFTEEYKEQWYKGTKYIDGYCTVITEKSVAVHWGVSEMLYYYLINNLTEEIVNLISILNSKVIQQMFPHILVKEDEVSLPMANMEEIELYLIQKSPGFVQIIHIFNELSNFIYIKNTRVIFRTNAILKTLETNKRIYNFDVINIE